MPQILSNLRPPLGPHKGLKVVRLKKRFEKGMVLEDCGQTVLYTGLCGRVLHLKDRWQENLLRELYVQGKDKAGIRKVMITPSYPLTKMTTSDYLIIPWGIKPNTFTNLKGINNVGPYIFLETPNGIVKLVWNGIKYASADISLESIDSEWCFTGDFNFCYSTNNILCETLPTGYNIAKISGPDAYFEIIKINAHEDHLGRLAYYELLVEPLDQEGVVLQE